MPRTRIAKHRTCGARWAGLRNTAAEESIGLRGIARVQTASDYATRWCTRRGCAWRSRGCWCRTSARLQRVALGSSSGTARAVAEVLREVRRGVLLHARCGGCVAAVHSTVDHVKATLGFIQSQLKVGIAASREVLRTPFNVKDAVRSSTTYRCEYAEASVDQIQIIPVREDRVVVGSPRQASVSKGRVRCRKLGIAVGRQINAGEALVVQGEWERQRDRGDRVIAMVADVRGTRHDGIGYLRYSVLAGARCRGSGRCRARRACWCRASRIAIGANKPIANQTS